MLLIDYSLETPQANLAFDEALLESLEPNSLYQPTTVLQSTLLDSEKSDEPSALESLRLWEMPSMCVIMGRGSKEAEVDLLACAQDGVPVLKRCSGGASIVAGPGCLMYSLLLSLEHRPPLRSIDTTHAFVMQKIHEAIATMVPQIHVQGTCDLSLGNRKFSGNAVKYKREWLLYHGTLLYQFPIATVSRYLKMPPRQPAYREARDHSDFLVNLECNPNSLRQALTVAWKADQPWASHPHSTTILNTMQSILGTKYA